MTVSAGTDAPSPPTPADDAVGRDRPAVMPGDSVRETATAVCPYLVSESGSWRSATPSRDHRCGAVQPHAAQTTEKQRRHCLAADHVDCPTFRAARTARTASLAAGANPAIVERADRLRRPVARTAPIVLEPPRLVDQATRLRLDRGPGQIALVALMVLAFGVVAIARFAGSPSAPPAAGPSQVAIASQSARPSPTPTATPSPSIEPSQSASPEPSFRTTYKVRKGDTLSSIAKRFKTTAAKIKTLNGLTSNTIHSGQVLKIP